MSLRNFNATCSLSLLTICRGNINSLVHLGIFFCKYHIKRTTWDTNEWFFLYPLHSSICVFHATLFNVFSVCLLHPQMLEISIPFFWMWHLVIMFIATTTYIVYINTSWIFIFLEIKLPSLVLLDHLSKLIAMFCYVLGVTTMSRLPKYLPKRMQLCHDMFPTKLPLHMAPYWTFSNKKCYKLHMMQSPWLNI